jgi:preprotein translocase subunit YajC
MDLLIPAAYAQASGGAPAQAGMANLIFMLVLFGVMFFMIIFPQMRRQKEHKKLLGALSKGDEVVFAGGLTGRVEELGDNFLTVEIANNTRIKVQRHAVSAVLPKGSLKSA